MQNSKKSTTQVRDYGIFLFDGFSNHCLANSVEPLRAANTIAGKTLYRWYILSLHGGPVQSSSGLSVGTINADDVGAGDALFVMPSYGYKSFCGYNDLRAMRRVASRFSIVAGFDTGSWLLAEAGLLDGYRATIHRDEFTAFSESFTEVIPVRRRFVIDRDRITCTGAAAAFDLVVGLITEHHGQAMGLELEQIFMMRGPETGHWLRHSSGDRMINQAMEVMEAHLENPLAIGQIAAQSGCSQKSLELRVRARLGMTPRALYRRLRLALARKLLQETDLKIAEIALRSGYENASAMTRAFRSEFGLSPRALRHEQRDGVADEKPQAFDLSAVGVKMMQTMDKHLKGSK